MAPFEYIMLNGAIDDQSKGLGQGLLPDPSRPTKVGATLVLYHPENDVIHEVNLTGVLLTTRVYPPEERHRIFVNANAVTTMFREKKWGAHELKEILAWAMEGILSEPTKYPDARELFEELSKLHHDLGGFDS